MSTLCRNCAYYKNKPHKIIWEFTNEIEEYDGVCIAPYRPPIQIRPALWRVIHVGSLEKR